METTLNPHIAAQLVRYWMKRARKKAQKSQSALGKLLDLAQPTIAGYESGRALPPEDHLKQWLEFCDRHSDFAKLQSVLAAANFEKPRGEVVQITGVADASLRIGLDYFATTIQEYIPNVVTGLLQTEDYAREILDPFAHLWPPVPPSVDQAKLRIERHEVLRLEEPPSYTAFVDEMTLREPVGSGKVHGEQLQFLLDITEELAHVEVRVIPRSARHHPLKTTYLALLTFDDDAALSCGEDWFASHYYNDAEAISTATRLLGHLGDVGLQRSESRGLIAEILKEVRAA